MIKNIHFISKELSNNQAIVVFINAELQLTNDLLLLDQQHHGVISKTIQNKLRFSGQFGQVKIVNSIGKDGEIKHLIIIGIGDTKKLESSLIEELGGKIASCAACAKISTIGLKLTSKITEHEPYIFAALIASGALLASYKFDKYKTKQKDEDKFTIDSIEIITNNIFEAEKLFSEKKSVVEAIFFARDIINEPANVKTPEYYAAQILKYLKPLDVDVDIIGEREMTNLGMGALLGVGQGSKNESQLVVMKYNGTDKDTPPITFVGKGVIFDSGGISLKPALNMEHMKYDMAGSAAVVGAIMALSLRHAKVNIVGVVGLVENMPSGSAQRPGDVVTTMSGQTVEILNTDAEGRLVLADAIWYVQDKFKPQCVIDLATLTGAIVIALGHSYAGCFANNDELADKLIHTGDKVNEKLWRMPLHKDFDAMINSDIADVANIGNVRGAAGSSAAAHFIGRFIKEGTIWAHLDIAGVAYNNKYSAIVPKKGAVGYGIRLLNQFIQDYYEE